jgi:hypothetical protein
VPQFRTSTRPATGAGSILAVVIGLALVGGWLAWPDGEPSPPGLPPSPPAAPGPGDFLYDPPTRWVGLGRTDAGRPVGLAEAVAPRPAADVVADEARALDSFGLAPRLVRRAPASDICNCHGWVFGGGKYWLLRADVEVIIADNGYKPVADPRPGDLAVYREADGAIAHTAIVRQSGGQLRVEGKWLWMGVFEHAVADSPFGTNVTYYRSPRAGHQIAGLDHPVRPSDGLAPGSELPDPTQRTWGPIPNR